MHIRGIRGMFQCQTVSELGFTGQPIYRKQLLSIYHPCSTELYISDLNPFLFCHQEVLSCRDTYCRADDIPFVTLNRLLFLKVRTWQSRTLSHLQLMTLTYLVFTSTHWSYLKAKAVLPDLFVFEVQLLLFWGGLLFLCFVLFCLQGEFVSCA